MNSFGKLFRVHIFGESHGCCTGVCVDGCPAGIAVSESDFETDLARRRSGAKGTTPRKESDAPKIMSGAFGGFTTGAPLVIMFENADAQSGSYSQVADVPRPGHADFVAGAKYKGFADYRGGGHFSGRLTTGLVAAGVVAKKIIAPATVAARISEIGGYAPSSPEEDAGAQWDALLERCMAEGDSIGGVVECRVENVPAGWGEPFFDGVESAVAHIVFAIPAIKGVEFGAGFAAARMSGSEHNDAFIGVDGKTATNHAGGVNGGITNGNPVVFRVAVKPTSSIARAQKTINMRTGEMRELETAGRHDACIALRMSPVVEAAAAIALADLKLQNIAY